MAKSPEITRITAFVDEDLLESLNELTTEIGLSKEKLLRSTLDDELDNLETMSENELKAKRWHEAISSTLKSRKKRLNITLDKKVHLRMQRLCEQKGITRDQFINEYIDFLVNGAKNGSCESPLQIIAMMIDNPRFQYHSIDSDTPYEDLYLSEEEAEFITNELISKAKVKPKPKPKEK